MIHRTQTETTQPSETNRIIELITTIMVYRFTHLSRQEIKAMLGITEARLQQTRFYQEVKEEGREEGRQSALLEVAANLLHQGFTLEQVATATGLEIAQVQNLQAS